MTKGKGKKTPKKQKVSAEDNAAFEKLRREKEGEIYVEHTTGSVTEPVDRAKQPLALQLNSQISTWRDDKKPDKKLSDNIKEYGQLQAIIARRLPNGELEIACGHRRYAAMKALGMTEAEMKIDILEGVSDIEAVFIALAENKIRKDLSPIEEGRAYRTLKELGLNSYDIAKKLDIGETTVRERMDLLELPEEVQKRIVEGKIQYSCARALTKLNEHPTEQKALAADMAKGKRYGYQEWDAKNADRAVHEILDKLKERQAVFDKYGPCPKCGSVEIEEQFDKPHLHCIKCGFSYNGNTKEPWAIHEIRKHAEKIGLKASVTDGKVELSPEAITEVIEKRKEVIKAAEDPTLRTKITIDAIAARVLTENVRSISIDGDKVELRLKRDDQLHFVGAPHDYQDGNRTKIIVQAGWQTGDGILERRPVVEKFLASLEPQQQPEAKETDT